MLPPPSKRRKTEHKIEEIQFDFSAREDYLTGFHKRKVQRSRAAALQREKEAKEERIKMRKQVCLFLNILRGRGILAGSEDG